MSPQQKAIESPGGWLTRVASRICLDLLGSARARRESYVGEWIPEPLPDRRNGSTGGRAAPRSTRPTESPLTSGRAAGRTRHGRTGPPGTGKTHTAAALITHLLAQGKRVLVTAHTDRALKEVGSKLPESIKPLSVAIVGAALSTATEN